MKIFKTIVFTLFALMFINAGLDKFLHYMPIPDLGEEIQKVMNSFMTIKWIMPLTGAIELLSGILIIFPKTRILGAIMISPVMVGILAHNATFIPKGLIVAGVLFAINIWILFDNSEKIKALVS